jgi:hypothetical protein
MNIPKVGDMVYLLNVGNNARNRNQELSPAKVVKVGRKLITVKLEGNWRDIQFYIESGREKTDFSSGWRLYLSQQDWEDEKEAIELSRSLRETFNTYGRVNLPLGALRQIHDLVEDAQKPFATQGA